MLKRKYEELQRDSQSMWELYNLLRSRSEPEALEILRRIRSSEDLESVLSLIRDGDLLIQRLPSAIETARNALPPIHCNIELNLTLQHPNAYPMLPPLSQLLSELGQPRSPIQAGLARKLKGKDSPTTNRYTFLFMY
jgi:hypothetical protein